MCDMCVMINAIATSLLRSMESDTLNTIRKCPEDSNGIKIHFLFPRPSRPCASSYFTKDPPPGLGRPLEAAPPAESSPFRESDLPSPWHR